MAVAADPKVKGYLVVTVSEATGKNKDEVVVWDPAFVEGFVKGEWIRGGGREEGGGGCAAGRESKKTPARPRCPIEKKTPTVA